MGEGQKQAGGWAGVIREDANHTDAGVRFCLIHVATEKSWVPATLRSEARLSRVVDCLKAVEQ